MSNKYDKVLGKYREDDSGSSYTLPTASASVLGGIKVGTRLSIDGNGVLSADVQAGGGDVLAPATNTADYLPQWNGANSKTLKDGLAVPAGGLAGITALNAKQDALTFGIADTNKVQINAADVADNDYAKFTATGLEGRSYAEVLSDIGASTKALDNLASVAINTSLVSDTDITDDLGTGDIRWKDIHAATLNSGLTATDTLKLRGYDTDLTGYIDILTITSANTVTADLNAIVTRAGGKTILDTDHTALTTGIHGLAITAGQTLTVTTGGTIGSAAYTAATAYAAALSGTQNEIAYFNTTTTIASLAVASYPSLTELAYVKGVTSAIQTQLGTKAPSTAPTFATSITGSYLTASEILITDASKNIVSAAVATYPSLTELTYLKGVSSAIQTQLGGKAAALAGTINEIAYFNSATTIASLAVTTYPSLTELSYAKGVTSAIQTQFTGKLATGLAAILLGIAGGQTLNGSTLTAENLTLRANAADLTTGAVIVSSSKEASSTTVGSVQLAGGLAVAKRVYALDMTVTNTITGTTSGNLISGGALGTPSSGTGTNITGIPAANILAGSFGAGAFVISTSLQAATIELGAATDTTLARVSAGVVSIEGSNIMTVGSADTVTGVKTLGTTGAIKLGSAVTDKCEIRFNDSALNDETWSGIVLDAVAGATLAVGDVCYLKTADGQWYLNDGILDGTDTGCKLKLGICVLAANDNGATKILLNGLIASAAFPAFTVGAPVYLDDTAGDLVVAQPTTANFLIRMVGYAVSATVLHFDPDNSWIVHV